MNKMYFSNRLANFNTQEKDLMVAFQDLYGHYRYERAPEGSHIKNKYRQYASDKMTIREKEDKFSKNFIEVTNKYAGVALDSEFSASRIRTNPQVQWATFALVGEMIDMVVPETVLDSFYRFAETRNVAWGDNLVFNLPSNDLFVVSTAANGKKRGDRQRLHGTDVTLTPVNHSITIGEDFYRILAGKVNWGDWISRIAQSIETAITVEVYNQIVAQYDVIGASYKESGAFNKNNFNKLVQRVEAANRGLSATAFGTKLALSNVLPDNQYLQFQLGEEYNRMGYLPNFQGTPLFMFEQRLVPNSDEFALSDNNLFVFSTGLEKIVKIGFEGETQIIQSQTNENADQGIVYTLQKMWDAKVATAAKFAIWDFSEE